MAGLRPYVILRVSAVLIIGLARRKAAPTDDLSPENIDRLSGRDDAFPQRMRRLLEEVVELVHRARRAHPAEAVGLHRDLGLEMLLVMLSDDGIDAVGGHHDIGRGAKLFDLLRVDAAAEGEPHPFLAAARMWPSSNPVCAIAVRCAV